MNRHGVDDADDRGVHRRSFFSQRFTRGAPFEHDEHLLVDARADTVDRQQRVAPRRFVDVEGLHEQQLGTLELSMFLRRHDGADHARDLHLPEIPVIDDADDAGIDGRFGRRIKRKARFLAAHEKDFFADTSADRVDRHQRPSGRFTGRGPRLDEQQLDPHELLIFARDDDVADDPRELHYSLISTASTMPTMAASTGQSFMPDAIRAELPLTIRTVSPTPASTVSTATR